MVTPPAFANIGYQTYIIFAVINAFMVPCVYFFYPETAYRSLEEVRRPQYHLPYRLCAELTISQMDEIFQECHGLRGAFDVVKIAREKPRRYDKHGNLLINYDDTEYAHRRHSSAGAGTGAGVGVGGTQRTFDEKKSDDNTNGSEERQEHV